ncbi:alpha-ketoglutarate-dependent dioxygenase alkB homolog 6-like isoform X3 [Solanum pennellii]|uniref:Alpha-ketoglutarate-dependent dioxygenase alkB homolog 6-like isoform X3 n=1 Tax=Solanum pennellii TaxID=28526 RepID=A0ABM1GQ26_SOLPN|nr:alpha-ketoglutarate-dependent dioxygenase alkB homolog 6-like isoform X3 [Solanum pennellii]
MEMSKTLNEFRVGSVPTVFYIPDFVTESEHHHLLKTIYDAPISKWKSLTNRRLQNWGGVVHEKGLIAQDLPPWLNRITERINEKWGLFPSSVNINEYLHNQGIMPRQDGPAYYPVVAILSLGSPEAGVMNSSEWLDNFHPFSIILMPRSLLIFKDMVYSEYLHGIKDSEVHGCNRVVNVTNVQNHGVVQHSSGSVKGLDSDNTFICRANTRVSLTCRVVTKVYKSIFKF